MKRVGRFLLDNERLLVVAASTMIMSLSHTALRPVLPVFAKVSPACLSIVLTVRLVCLLGACQCVREREQSPTQSFQLYKPPSCLDVRKNPAA